MESREGFFKSSLHCLLSVISKSSSLLYVLTHLSTSPLAPFWSSLSSAASNTSPVVFRSHFLSVSPADMGVAHIYCLIYSPSYRLLRHTALLKCSMSWWHPSKALRCIISSLHPISSLTFFFICSHFMNSLLHILPSQFEPSDL